jgi:hypothetical protein
MDNISKSQEQISGLTTDMRQYLLYRINIPDAEELNDKDLFKALIEDITSLSIDELDHAEDVHYVLEQTTHSNFEQFSCDFFELQSEGVEPYIEVCDLETEYMSLDPESDFEEMD